METTAKGLAFELTHIVTSDANRLGVRGPVGDDEHTWTEFRGLGWRQERIWLTRNKGGEASEGNHSPEIIPPEHALLDAKDKPSDGDQARDEEEGQREVWTGGSARPRGDGGRKTDT